MQTHRNEIVMCNGVAAAYVPLTWFRVLLWFLICWRRFYTHDPWNLLQMKIVSVLPFAHIFIFFFPLSLSLTVCVSVLARFHEFSLGAFFFSIIFPLCSSNGQPFFITICSSWSIKVFKISLSPKSVILLNIMYKYLPRKAVWSIDLVVIESNLQNECYANKKKFLFHLSLLISYGVCAKKKREYQK